MRILGIDPGKTTGYAIIDADADGWTLVARGEWTPYGDCRGEQLCVLVSAMIDALHGADVAAMEELLAYRQATADEKVEAQAVAKMTCWERSVELVTYAPVTVRSVICRDGQADDKTIKQTLRFLARAPKTAKRGEGWSDHQYDALAVALCHLARSGMVLDRCVEAAA